jgi:hypothetical protein
MSRTKREWEVASRMVAQLTAAGVTYEDAWQLRRISMTLQKWFELECGDSNGHGSWAIVRGVARFKKNWNCDCGEVWNTVDAKREHAHAATCPKCHSRLNVSYRFIGKVFEHDDDGLPFEEFHPHSEGGVARYTRLPDREKGARKRLAKIMTKYPALKTFIQGDPRGCALYVLREGDVPEGADVSSCYTRGIAVHQ